MGHDKLEEIWSFGVFGISIISFIDQQKKDTFKCQPYLKQHQTAKKMSRETIAAFENDFTSEF